MPNNRCDQLKALAREHDEALAFADRISGLASDGGDAALAEAIQLVKVYYENELEQHLQQEEQTMFAPLLQHGKEHFPLCMQLGKEHGFLRTVVTSMRHDTARQDLRAFADVLRAHTLFEEERFLPLVESLFTPEQLDAILHFKPVGTLPNRSDSVQ